MRADRWVSRQLGEGVKLLARSAAKAVALQRWHGTSDQITSTRKAAPIIVSVPFATVSWRARERAGVLYCTEAYRQEPSSLPVSLSTTRKRPSAPG